MMQIPKYTESMAMFNDVKATITQPLDALQKASQDIFFVKRDPLIYTDACRAAYMNICDAIDSLKDALDMLEGMMRITPDLIDQVRSVVINNSWISTEEVGMKVGVDTQTALNALNWLWANQEIRRKTGRGGIVHWFDDKWIFDHMD